MSTGVIIVLAIILLFTVLMFINCTLLIVTSKDFSGGIEFRAGIIRIKRKVDEERRSDERKVRKETRTEQETKQMVRIMHTIKNILLGQKNFFYRHLTFSELTLDILVGSSDAALTAISYGAISAAVYPLIGILKSRFTVKKDSISVAANFTATKLTYFFKARLSLKVYEIIVIILVIIREYLKVSKQTK